MKRHAAIHDREGNVPTAGQSVADVCPETNLAVPDDDDPTMPVLLLSEDEKDLGYDPYDTGSFWAAK